MRRPGPFFIIRGGLTRLINRKKVKPIRSAFRPIVLMTALLAGTQSASAIRPHPMVPGDLASTAFTVRADGTNVPVVDWYGDFAYAHLSLEAGDSDAVELEVETASSIGDYSISPLRDTIAGSVDGKVLSFSVEGRRYLKLSIDNLPTLFIFIDPVEGDRVLLGDPGVADVRSFGADETGATVSTAAIQAAIDSVSSDPELSVLFFPAGEYRSGTLDLKSNVTLYLDEGALLKASDRRSDFNCDNPGGPYERLSFISAHQAENVAIRGRGVIDGNGYELRNTFESDGIDHTIVGRPGTVDAERVNNVQFAHCRNVLVDGVFSRNSSSWNTIPYYCDDVMIRNYKVLANMQWKNDDGIDPDSCRRLVIRDSIFLSRDDSVVLKTCGTYNGQKISPDGDKRDMFDVLVENNLLWSETAAMKYGYNESEASEVYRVSFNRNVVLATREGVQLFTGGPAYAHHFTFRENHYELCTSQNYRLIDSDNDSMRFINEVHEDFGANSNQIQGTDFEFYNLRIAGRVISDADRGRFVGQTGNASFFSNTGPIRVIDNDDPGFSTNGGSWTASSTNSELYGDDYEHDGSPSAKTADTWAQWASPFAEPTECDLYLWWSDDPNRADDVPVIVSHAGGVEEVARVDQTRNGARWNFIGRFTMGSGDYLRILATDAGYTIADAARFEAVGGADVSVPPEVAATGAVGYLYPDEAGRFDSGGDAGLSLELAEGASHGNISINGGIMTYTPNAGFKGADSFIFRLTDGWESSWARVRVQVDDRTIEHWRKRELDGVALSGDREDPDADGLRNLEEYHFGTDPLTPDAPPFGIVIEGASVLIRVREALVSPSSSAFLQSSDGPSGFTDTGLEGVVESSGATQRTRRFELSPGAGETQRFFRLRIERH